MDARQEHGDRCFRVVRKRLLGLTTLLAQADEACPDSQAAVTSQNIASDGLGHMGEDGFVEVDPAKALQALRLAEEVEAVLGLAEHGRIEGPATKIVDRDDGSGRDALLEGIMRRRGDRLGQKLDVVEARLPGCLAEEVQFVGPIAPRMGHGDRSGRLAPLLSDVGDNGAEHLRHERLSAEWRASQDVGRRVAETPLELAGGARGLAGPAARGGVAGEQDRIFPEKDDRRDRGGVGAQLEDVGAVVLGRGGGRIRGPEVDPERVAHVGLLVAARASVQDSSDRAAGADPSSGDAMSTREQAYSETVPDTPMVAARRTLELAVLAARAYNRPDLEDGLSVDLGRMARPQTLIAVVGEFKKGKSSLINALLGRDIAPVDDDLATAVTTLYQYAEQPRGVVLASEDERDVQRVVPLEEALSLGQEQGNPENVQAIRAIEIHFPNEFLRTGAVLIDTPGAGGFALNGAGVSHVLLRAVDAVVMVSDASGPIMRPELDLLIRSAAVCPATLLVLSKVDLYPAWRQIALDDEAVLAAASLDAPVLPVSSVLMGHARRREDVTLATQSGVPALREMLDRLVLDASRAEACRRGLANARAAIQQIQESTREELAALEDPEEGLRRAADHEEAKARLEHLRGPGSRWSQVLVDVLADSSGEADHQFRLALRTLLREVDEDLETIDPGRHWETLAEKVRARVGLAIDAFFAQVESGAHAAERAVVEWLRTSDGLDLTGQQLSTSALAGGSAIRAVVRPGRSQYAGTLFSGLRGGQGGILTIGMVASLAGITLTTAATAGIGLVFGGKQILDERKRQLQARRQEARTSAKQFIDDVQFETNKQVRDLSRDLQRQLRDGFLELVATRQRTCSESLAAIQATVQTASAARAAKTVRLRERLDHLQVVDTRAAELEGLL